MIPHVWIYSRACMQNVSHFWRKPRLSECALGTMRHDELLDPLEPVQQLILRLRVCDPDVPLPRMPERCPRQHRDTCLGEQPIRQLTLSEPRALDIRKRVESPLRPGAAHAGEIG